MSRENLVGTQASFWHLEPTDALKAIRVTHYLNNFTKKPIFSTFFIFMKSIKMHFLQT